MWEVMLAPLYATPFSAWQGAERQGAALVLAVTVPHSDFPQEWGFVWLIWRAEHGLEYVTLWCATAEAQISHRC